MRSVPQNLQRAFWSIYGRIAWDAARPPWHATQVRQVVEILSARRGAPDEWVLDAGCGTGGFAVALAEAGFRVVGIDYAEGMLAAARAKVAARAVNNLSFQQADLNGQLEFPNERFDHVINISVLQATAEPVSTLTEMCRVLKPGGTLVLLHVPRPNSYDLSLYAAVRNRVRGLEKKRPWTVALIAAKTWAERAGNTRYWTTEALRAMLEDSQFEVQTVDQGPPIVIVARRMIPVRA